jgi:hypothetical protein
MMSLLLSRAAALKSAGIVVSGPATGAHDAALLSWTSTMKSGVKPGSLVEDEGQSG